APVLVAAVGVGRLDRAGGDPRRRERPGGAPMKRAATIVAVLAVVAAASCTRDATPASIIRVGAVYPLSGAQGPGGRDEFRGVQLAVDLVNGDGGGNGEPVQLLPIDV